MLTPVLAKRDAGVVSERANVHAERAANEIRIISARPAAPHERRPIRWPAALQGTTRRVPRGRNVACFHTPSKVKGVVVCAHG